MWEYFDDPNIMKTVVESFKDNRLPNTVFKSFISVLCMLGDKFSVCVKSQELEVLSLSHQYSLKTRISRCHCVMTFMRLSVLGFRSDIRIELQAPVVEL